ncbi:JmjC-domain-containing protein [Cylindrobasidium torrendii FP15055 ss-10]|uniref:[histone H3]-trimethyl-L-lysine(9) demethylase n=1 Tax=Cylindrobasidium torrendii FP15055 ss-10 TaxID=1314674 RepID=A0A0D7AWW9_9AGAR|nr:JmjC-domain-containing protein [Cylindrobasidium torrendii FP15055 ss-10]
MSSSGTPSLTSGGSSPAPSIPVQPDHFYRATDDWPPAPNAAGYFDPEDDPLAARGIPVFKPSMEEFADFETYMDRIECWGLKSGIVKVIPPAEWTESLPPMKEQLRGIKIKTPIEQRVSGTGGHFRQENWVKRKEMSVREWVEMCTKDDYRAPGVSEVGLRSGGKHMARKPARSSKRSKSEETDDGNDYDSDGAPRKGKKVDKAKLELDNAFLDKFEPTIDWLPPGTIPEDYSPKFCEELARHFWRNCGIGKAPWYGADSQGSIFTDATTSWNVAHLESALTRLLPSSDKGLPGVNTPYLYWGMWKATFAWHLEDMDLSSINYIHFGAPKFWYAIPQGRSKAFEQTMKGLFPTDAKSCSQFLRHKQFLVSPSRLSKDSCAPNHCVQSAGEFIITYPRGYHAGFNLGLNCAESVNFALDSWIPLGRVAKACECVSDSVRIDVETLLEDREYDLEMGLVPPPKRPLPPSAQALARRGVAPELPPPEPRVRKRSHVEMAGNGQPASSSTSLKRARTTPPADSLGISVAHVQPSIPKLTLRLSSESTPKTQPYWCCLCVSGTLDDLLPVLYPPYGIKEAIDAAGNPSKWLAHRGCADSVPETWVDRVAGGENEQGQDVVCGVEWISKDRWKLKCNTCGLKGRGAPIQCGRGKCPKAFHVPCAKNSQNGVGWRVTGTTENEVVMRDETGGKDEILKVIRKTDVEILCAQHNPANSEQRRLEKKARRGRELMTLNIGSLIKLRPPSGGMFEVSMVRVLEAEESVEVIWDKDAHGNFIKRVFGWETVVGIVGREAPPKKHVLTAREKAELVANGQPVPQAGPSEPRTFTAPPAQPSGLAGPGVGYGSSPGYGYGGPAPYGVAPSHATGTTPYGAAAGYGAYSFGGGWHAAPYSGQYFYQPASSPTEQPPPPSFEWVVPERSGAAATT